jgi:hypothetical protein
MTKPANSKDKASPSDTPTDRPNDNGNETVVHREDRDYNAEEPHGGDIAKKRENEEQPVAPIKMPPAEEGMEKGQVQPD